MDDAKQKLGDTLKSELKDNELSPDNLVSVTLTLMKTVEGFSSLTGAEKKQLVLDTIKLFITSNLSEGSEPNKYSTIIVLLSTTLPILIDSFVSIDKQGLFKGDKKSLCFFC
jgi:hypothetical protein